MLEKKIHEFVADAENLTIGAVVNDDFVKIHTQYGNAVLVSEAEWNIMTDALKKVLHDAT